MRTFTIQLMGLVRYLRPDRNPLRRPVDRTHVRATIVLGVLLLVLAPLAMIVTARLAGSAGLRAERVQARARHLVSAVVLDTTPNGTRGVLDETVRIGWRDTSGVTHTSIVPAVGGERAGAHRSVWIDRTGRLTTHPRRHSQTVADSIMAALTAVTLLGLLHSAAHTLMERRLERRRLELWEREWAAVAPRWTGLP
ncbi:MAG: Rv1733c family protein [Actinoallomurus sp.]